MRLLLTGAASPTGRRIAAGLRSSHQLRLTDSAHLETDLPFVCCDLDHGNATGALMDGIDAVVHQAYLPRPGDAGTDWIDRNTRCTYNLLTAAAAADVRRVIYLSSLELFVRYEPDLAVAEDWRPLPGCDPDSLGPYLGEFVAREFAHSGELHVLVMRLGHVVDASEVEGVEYDPMWVDSRDVVGAIEMALAHDPSEFSVLHLQHRSPRARFRGRSRRRSFRFVPEHSFGEDA